MRSLTHVVAVIERKIWRARDEYTAGIDQLLGYLAYADTRAAYVLLIRRQDVSSVVEQVKALTLSHSSCVDEQSPPGVGRIDYRFHATGDPDGPPIGPEECHTGPQSWPPSRLPARPARPDRPL